MMPEVNKERPADTRNDTHNAHNKLAREFGCLTQPLIPSGYNLTFALKRCARSQATAHVMLLEADNQ
eukprot:1150907-Pelagomonas_calceolata.AAC.3